MPEHRRVLVWTDRYGVSTAERPIAYPEGIHNVIAGCLNEDDELEAAPVAEDESVLSPDSLAEYQCLVMWGHGAPISLEAQQAVVRQVESGRIGVVGLHSILIFNANAVLVTRLFGQTTPYGWEDGVPMRYVVEAKGHPVFEGVDSIDLTDEAYYEFFGLVEGAETLLTMEVPDCESRTSNIWNPTRGAYEPQEHRVAGLKSRAAWTYQVGLGKSLYFQPGHETDPTYRNPVVQGILRRAVKWVMPSGE